MFRKEFKVKSNTNLKSSDKKKFVALLHEKFNIENEIALLKNEDVLLVKILTHNDRLCEIYTVNGVPWVFTLDKTVFPTVYLLWKYPNCSLFPFLIHEVVVEKIRDGADVMLPGLIIDGEPTVKKLGNLEKGALCVVRTPANRAVVAIGTTNISSIDMLHCGLRGKGIQIVHVIGDFLWKSGSKEPLPIIPVVEELQPDSLSVEAKDEGASIFSNNKDLVVSNLESTVLPKVNDEQCCQSTSFAAVDQVTLPEENDNHETCPDSITDRFIDYFLLAAKQHLKSPNDLPILVSTFQGKFLSQMIIQAGVADQVSVQKTEFKKFSVFLQKMQDLGVIKVEEQQKGVQRITNVNFQHEIFGRLSNKQCSVKKEQLPLQQTNENRRPTKSADFKEMFSLTADVLPLVRQFNGQAKKGDPVSAPDIRRMATDYVKREQLLHVEDGTVASSTTPPKICLDPLLAGCSNRGVGEKLTWPKFFDHLFARLTPCYEFKFTDGSSGVKKGKPPSITISKAKRSGNKNVILINNVTALGVDPVQFSKDLQVRMAASAVLNNDLPPSVSQGPQVQVQGNKVSLVVELLCEKYGVPKNFVKLL